MNVLRRRGILAVLAFGVMMGTPSLAKPNAAAQKQKVTGNYLDALAVAKANLLAAKANAEPPKTKLSPEVAKEVSDKLGGVISDIDNSKAAFQNVYQTHPPQNQDPGKGMPGTLTDQLATALKELKSGSVILEEFSHQGNAAPPLRIKADLEVTTRNLEKAQELVANAPPPTQLADPGNGGKQTAPQPQPSPAEKANSTQTQPEKQNAPISSKVPWPLVLNTAAILLAAAAILLVFLPVGPVKRLRSRQEALDESLMSVDLRRRDLADGMMSLKKEVVELAGAVTRIAEHAKASPKSTPTEWTSQERPRSNQTQDLPKAAQPRADGLVAGPEKEASQMIFNRGATTREGESTAGEGKASPIPPVVPAAKPREPVADYNLVRAMKAADRITEFGGLYPKQMIMTCTNPSARNNGPFTELRFKEDYYGKFQAVEHGRETQLFPELNYDYITGRKTLEGVFQYPEVESASMKLTQAAILEKRGDEWALTSQGVFQNG